MGCPQGSCFGPLLWNKVVDEVLHLQQDPGTFIQAYADDIAILASGSSRIALEQSCTKILELIVDKLEQLKLSVSFGKSSAIVSTSLRRTRRPIFRVGTHKISVKDTVDYLGLTIDPGRKWNDQIRKLRTMAVRAVHQLLPMRTGKWGIPLDILRIWYLTVIEKRLLYGCAIWAPGLATHLWRHLATTQRFFLLLVTKAYRTTSTDALVVLAGVPPIRLTALRQAKVTRFLGFRLDEPSLRLNGLHRTDFEDRNQDMLQHPARETPNMTTPTHPGVVVYTDGSKSEKGTAAAFVAFRYDSVIHTWGAKLRPENTVFQAELAAIHHASQWLQSAQICGAIIYTDCEAAVKIVLKPDCTNCLVQAVQGLVRQQSLRLEWIRAHIGIRGNEFADLLARQAATASNGNTQKLSIPLPWSLYKRLRKEDMLAAWQQSWGTSSKGRDLYVSVPKVQLAMPFTIRQLTVFFSGHGPFPANLAKQTLIASDRCVCGEEGSRLHYLWECQLTSSWHMPRPTPEHLEEWMRKLASNAKAFPRIISLVNFLKTNELQLRYPVPE